MRDTINELYELITERKTDANERSYTAYLFREGLDKILKKCGEECSEVIIAAKSLQAETRRGDSPEADVSGKSSFAVREKTVEFENEICDLIYHLLVLMADLGIPLSSIESILRERFSKTGNLKEFKTTDKNS
ncbi:MAG: phosphoribosyl-ATP diphosphatase [Clostridiales Family XIII bacterium]|jgi:phosphoribosyl-ATP pyrophosphohydrolase|nr:phosphoribosyl-ATP diphosphatase [Clostridiales Family XIII bacterium]